MSTQDKSLSDRLFAPQWAGGWQLSRILLALAALAGHLPRAWGIGDVYGVQDLIFTMGPMTLNNHVQWSEGTAWGLWTAGLLGLFGLVWGGRAAKPGLLLWFGTTVLLLVNETLNVKAYDRLFMWVTLAFLLSPIGERKLTRKWRSPAGRWVLLVVFMALYGSTGWLKAIKEPTWWTNGDVLAYHMLHHYFGMKTIGVWASTQKWLLLPLCWGTVIFEAAFPVLVWFRRVNPWLLLVGALMHLGIRLFMNVGPFSYLALAVYPVLLHPEVAREWWERWQRRSAGGVPSSGRTSPT